MALTDINNTSCMGEFISRCKEAGIKPLAGIDFRNDEGEQLYVGIARNGEGFYQLNKYLTYHSLESKPLPEIFNHALTTNHSSFIIIYPRRKKPITEFRENEYLGIRPEYVNLLFSSEVKHYPHKLLIFSPVTFLDEEGFKIHQLLRCIDMNIVLGKLTKDDIAPKTEMMHPPEMLLDLYKLYPKIIENTQRLVDSCSIELETDKQAVNHRTYTDNQTNDFALLKKLTFEGFERRYPKSGLQNREKALQRINKELAIIERLGYCAYFLITWDVVTYARMMGYHCVGRGSGANSIIAFCLRITDVDPIELDLYFERFINEHRKNLPDFDIDFSWDERDDVIDYVFKRYGKEYTALLATYSTFKGKAIVRELGKVVGLPKAEIDKIIANPNGGDELHELSEAIFHYGHKIKGFPNHLSIHAGGIIISEKPINYHTSLRMMPKGFPITHFDMYHGEKMGFHKLDILSQRGLGHVKEAVDIIKQNQNKDIDIHDITSIKADKKVRQQLKSGKCMGCFYVESPAMRGLLSKLRCDTYIHLVAASSIIRPGVANSGMMREYIRRFHNPNAIKYLHLAFEEHLGETFGVMVYQEDVIKILHHFADLGLGESDVLRRIMNGKKAEPEQERALERKYFENCKRLGHSDSLTKEVWRQVKSFAGYSFCKAHSASFAVESFQSLYLKAYFPIEFMVAVINNFGGFYRTEYYFHEARMCGAIIHAPCVNHSHYLTSIEGKDIHIGFIHLHSMEKKVAHRIVHQRSSGGLFLSLTDFVNRVDISAEQLEILIRIGAFRFSGLNKYELMWEKNAVFNPKEKFECSGRLFPDPVEKFQLPDLKEEPLDQAFDEIELLGFPLRSPFDLLVQRHHAECTSAADLPKAVGRMVTMLGYYVCKKDVRTVTNKQMSFGTWLDEDGHFFDTTHFPYFLKTSPFQGKGIYKITGKAVEEYGFPSLEVVKMERLAFRVDERYGE